MRTLSVVVLCLALSAAACESVPVTPLAAASAPGQLSDDVSTEPATAATSPPAVEVSAAEAVNSTVRPAAPPPALSVAPAAESAATPAQPPPSPPSPETLATGSEIVAHYGEMWPWIAEAWTFSKVRLYDQLRHGDFEQTCEAWWRVPCASGTPWWVSLPDLSPTGAVLHALALIWLQMTPDTTEWNDLARAFREHYDGCYNRWGERLSGVLLAEAMVWAVVDGNVLREYGNYSEAPGAWRSGGDCAADPAEPPAHLRKTLEALLFNCGADQAAVDAGGWKAVADRACPTYTPYGADDYGAGVCAPANRATNPVLAFTDAPALCIDTMSPHTAIFHTPWGVVHVALDVTNTPGTANNFVNLARSGYYDGTLIHRGAPSLGILQGGSPYTNPAVDPGPGYTLQDEGRGFTYRPGQLVMARRAGPNSAGAQYLFTVSDDAALLDSEGAHVVFGKVIKGFEILEEILRAAPEPLVVDSVTIEVG